MADTPVLIYPIRDLLELNLSYMPFIKNGGLFIPTSDAYALGDQISVELQIPTKNQPMRVEGIVIWITPKNALHHVASGVGIQFTGPHAAIIKSQIEEMLDKTVEVGGYTYGISEETKRDKK